MAASDRHRLLTLRSASRRRPSPPPAIHEPDEPSPVASSSIDMRITSVEREVSRVDRRVERLKNERLSLLDRLIDERIGMRFDQEFMAAQRHRKGMLDAFGMLALALLALGMLYAGAMMVLTRR